MRSARVGSPAVVAMIVGEPGDDGELLVAVEGVGVGEHLDPHVAAVTVDVGEVGTAGARG